VGEGLLTLMVKLGESKESRKGLVMEKSWILRVSEAGLGGEIARRMLEPMEPRMVLPVPVMRLWVLAWNKRVR